MSLYGSVSEDYIKGNLNKDIYKVAYNACFNLSCALGDTEGKLTATAATQALSNLEIIFPGIVVLGEIDSDDGTPNVMDADYVEAPVYTPEVSRAAYEMFLALRASDPLYVIPVVDDVSVRSPLLRLSENINPSIRNAVHALFIEGFALYRALLGASTTTGLNQMVLQDLVRCSSNVRWISNRLESEANIHYDLVEAIRDMQRIVLYVSTLKQIFDEKEIVTLKTINSDMGRPSTNLNYSSREYTVSFGDTIQMIAQRQLGDASRATEIITFNNLDYPFITSDPSLASPTVKTMGDTISIPMYQQPYVKVATVGDQDLALTDSSLGGSDLFEDVYGDLEITSGIDSIRQDLFNKMLTPYGSLAYHPEYGSNLLKIIGNRKDVNWSDKAVIEIRRVLKTDNRVQRVVDVAVENLREGAHIRCYLVAKGYEVPISLERLIPYQEG